MNKTLYIIIVSLLLGYQSPVIAADPEAGKQLFQSKGCVGCHGANAISPEGTSYPNLAGQKVAYVEKALKTYRDKTREAPLMNGMATGLSDEDISNLAAYLSSLKSCP